MWISRRRRISAGFFPGSTLDMNFAQSRYLGATPSSLTVSRASTGYADDSAGVWSSFADNAARITNKGLLVEEARTNSNRNNSMQGAVAGTPGTIPTNWAETNSSGLTRTIVGVGTENGIDYIDIQYSGTTNGSPSILLYPELTSTIAAADGSVWTGSVFIRLVGGSLTNISSSHWRIQDNVGFTDNTSWTLSSSIQRLSTTRTVAVGGTRVWSLFRFAFAATSAVDFTVRIGWPQLEQGAFFTSPIRTTSAAVTRQPDAVTLTSVSWLTSQAPLTLYAETLVPQVNSGVAYRSVEIDNGTNTARLSNSGGSWLGIYNTDGSATAGTIAANVVQKAAVAVAANDLAACMNGGTVGTDASVTALTGLNRVTFGASTVTASVAMNGYVRRVAYFPTRLSNPEIQAITT